MPKSTLQKNRERAGAIYGAAVGAAVGGGLAPSLGQAMTYVNTVVFDQNPDVDFTKIPKKPVDAAWGAVVGAGIGSLAGWDVGRRAGDKSVKSVAKRGSIIGLVAGSCFGLTSAINYAKNPFLDTKQKIGYTIGSTLATGCMGSAIAAGNESLVAFLGDVWTKSQKK